MDTQDGQDRQDEKLLHRKLTGSMTARAFEVIREPESRLLESVSEKAMMIELSEPVLSVQSHPGVKVLFREKPVDDKSSCLSCPSMSISHLLMLHSEPVSHHRTPGIVSGKRPFDEAVHSRTAPLIRHSAATGMLEFNDPGLTPGANPHFSLGFTEECGPGKRIWEVGKELAAVAAVRGAIDSNPHRDSLNSVVA